MAETNSAKKTPKIGNYCTYIESPYSIVIESRLVVPKPNEEVRQTEDGKLWAMYEIPKGQTVKHDNKKYTKVFKGNTDMILRLCDPSMKMLWYIIDHLLPGKDEICILKEDYLTFAGFKVDNRLTYYRALDGLLKENIISRKVGAGYCFFINPDVVFNGDRTKLSNTIVSNKSSYKMNNDEDM